MTFNSDEVLNDTTEVKKEQSDSIEKQFQLFIEGRKGKRAKETIDFEKIMSIFEATGAVHAVAKIILDSLRTIQPTSVLTERTFSICGDFNRFRRCRISGQLLNALIILKYMN